MQTQTRQDPLRLEWLQPPFVVRYATSTSLNRSWPGAARPAPVVDARPVKLDVAGHGLRGDVPLGQLDVRRAPMYPLRLLHHNRRILSNPRTLEVVVS